MGALCTFFLICFSWNLFKLGEVYNKLGGGGEGGGGEGGGGLG